MLLGFMVVMGILMTKAMPPVITEVQRDQEEELIFRGEAIRNAIRRYKAITGQYPLKLEDLLKIRPRILRTLYLDPMTREGEWELVTAVQAGATGDRTGLPIVGVRSRSQKDSFKIYNGKTLYSDWVFSAAENLFGVPGSQDQSSQPQSTTTPQTPSGKSSSPGATGGDGGGSDKQ